MILLIFATALLIGACTIVHYFKNKYKYWESRGVPYDKPTLFFGSFWRFFFERDNLNKYLERTGKKYDSPYFGFFIFTKPILVIQDIEIAKRIFVKDFVSFPNKLFFPDKHYDPIFNNSLINLRGEDWRYMRRKLSPVFTTGKIKTMLEIIDECSDRLTRYLTNIPDGDLEVTEVASRFAADVISLCMFGVKCDCYQKQVHNFQYYGENILTKGTIGVIITVAYIFVHFAVKIFKFTYFNPEGVKYFRGVFTDIFNERKEQYLKRNDLVDILLDLKRSDGNNGRFVHDDTQLLAQAIAFSFAGQETTSSILSFTLHELSLNNSIQDRLRQEIVEISNRYGNLNYRGLHEMKYLSMVVNETLRKHPLTTFVQREALDDYTFPETGLQLERGTGIIVPLKSFHYDPKYFPNPEIYDPERFREQDTHMAFGIGPRGCIGKRFALVTIKMALVNILKKFKVERNAETRETIPINSPLIFRPENCVNVRFTHLSET
uniref:Cytochrome P450 n=1 Tax=Photinus pyralis TaxID=7054 RepID=A0A1Y1L314_PHOPY